MKGIRYQQPAKANANEGGGLSEFTSASDASAIPHNTTPSISIDYELYEDFLEGSDLTEEQKREFLDALWNIIVQFVDLGFGVHPLQQTGRFDHCEQFTEIAGLEPSELLRLPERSTKKD